MKWNEEIEKIWCYMIAQQNEIYEMPEKRTNLALECTKESDEYQCTTQQHESFKTKER